MKKNKTILAGIFMILLLFIIGSIEKMVFAKEGENGDVFVDKVTLLDSEGNAVTGEVSLEKQYKLHFELITPLQIKLDDADVMLPPYMEKGIEYLMPEISDDFDVLPGSFEVRAVDEAGNLITIATVRIGPDKIPIFTVDPNLDKGRVLEGFFEIDVRLNREKVGDAEDFTATLPKNGSLRATITENKKLPPVIGKEAIKYDEKSHRITWRITVQNPSKVKEELYPLAFSDLLGEGQTYVENSFQATISGNSMPAEIQTLENRIMWQCHDQTGNATISYEYQTEVDVLKLMDSKITNADIQLSAQNALWAVGADGSKLAEDLRASVPINGKTPVSITKSGGETVQYNPENDTGEIEWTIQVSVNGYEMKDLTVYDYFEAGIAKVRLKSEPVCVPEIAQNGKGYQPSPGTHNGNPYQWSYHIGDVSGNGIYTITYTTVIENYTEYLRRNNGTNPRNKGWFGFHYPLGDEEQDKEFFGPVMASDVKGIYANIITKTGIYDPATHRITWTITVNPNQIEVNHVSIADQIPKGQRYVSSSVTSPNGIKFATMLDEENNTVTFVFEEEGLNGKTAVITLVTELVESESGKWANNWSGTLENRVTMFGDVLPPEGITDTSRITAKSQVLDKELGNFAYTDHRIPVTIAINQNNGTLTGVTVQDMLLDQGLSLVTEKGVWIDGIQIDPGTKDDRPSYSYDKGILEIYPNETITKKTVITFTVEATDEYINEHRTKTSILIKNAATMVSDQYGKEVREEDTLTVYNRPIVKSGTMDPNTCVISYRVEFNRTLADLPAGLVLTDTLPDGLLFKLSTVKLWLADINNRTGALTKTDKEAKDYQVTIVPQETGSVLQVTMPTGKQAYILEYDVQIVDKNKAPFINNVDVSGYPDDGTKDRSTSFAKSQVAGARVENLLYVKVKKVDVSGNTLPGAVFALKQNDEQILMGAVKADGYVTFVGMDPNTEYTVVELQAPEGYVVSEEEWTFTTGTKGGEKNALEKVFVNRTEGDVGDNSGDEPGGEPDDSKGDVSGNKKPDDPQNSHVEMWEQSDKMMSEKGPEEEPEADRLPQTGGFWGSGIMYIIGGILAGLGLVILIVFRKKSAQQKDKEGEETL